MNTLSNGKRRPVAPIWASIYTLNTSPRITSRPLVEVIQAFWYRSQVATPVVQLIAIDMVNHQAVDLQPHLLGHNSVHPSCYIQAASPSKPFTSASIGGCDGAST